MRTDAECYCHTCKRFFHYLGVARHRAKHRANKEDCTITYSNGKTFEYNFANQSLKMKNKQNKMRISIKKSSGSGMPVILDDTGTPMDYADGIKSIRQHKKWSTRDMAEVAGVSHRTVEGWENGRVPSKPALLLLAQQL